MSTRPHDWEDPVILPPVNAPARVIVPFDGSHNAERALSWAAFVASATEGEIVFVVAYEQPLTMRGRGVQQIESTRDELEAEALDLATEAVGLVQARGVTARGIVIKGDVAHSILDSVDTEGGDLVIMGRQGVSAELGGLTGALDRVRDMLEGSIAGKVVRHASVPVLVVP
jgi:nucleotide-binding universal stress UspA family protein